MPNKKPNKVMLIDTKNLIDFDGITMDLESYKRHCNQNKLNDLKQNQTKKETTKENDIKTQNIQNNIKSNGAFICNPIHIGWHTNKIQQITYPIMAGALKPSTNVIDYFNFYTSSGSFLTSYLTSYTTSYTKYYNTSYLSSYFSSYFVFSSENTSFYTSCENMPIQGYGLELI